MCNSTKNSSVISLVGKGMKKNMLKSEKFPAVLGSVTGEGWEDRAQQKIKMMHFKCKKKNNKCETLPQVPGTAKLP